MWHSGPSADFLFRSPRLADTMLNDDQKAEVFEDVVLNGIVWQAMRPTSAAAYDAQRMHSAAAAIQALRAAAGCGSGGPSPVAGSAGPSSAGGSVGVWLTTEHSGISLQRSSSMALVGFETVRPEPVARVALGMIHIVRKIRSFLVSRWWRTDLTGLYQNCLRSLMDIAFPAPAEQRMVNDIMRTVCRERPS